MTPPADLVLADDCLWAGVLLPEFLPAVATDLLVQGVDTPALSQVAGLDLWPFDPRHALDLWNQAVDEAGVPTHPPEVRVARAAQVLAAAALEQALPARDVLQRFHCLALAAGYPNDDDLIRLDGLDDEWRWTRGDPYGAIEHEVRDVLASLAIKGPTPRATLVDSVPRSGS